MASPAGEPDAWVSLVKGLLPIATAVGGALWGLYAYFDNQREAQEAAARQAEHDGQSRLSSYRSIPRRKSGGRASGAIGRSIGASSPWWSTQWWKAP